MKRTSIRSHLRPYSIYGKRVTTIHHAFASAIASSEDYDEIRLSLALRVLEQASDQELQCVYCGVNAAETWDHIYGLVIDKRYSGYGHILGNLLPCCRSCNSSKGNKNWREFLRTKISDVGVYQERAKIIEDFLAEFQQPPMDETAIEQIFPEQMEKFRNVHRHILELMKEADVIAADIRRKVQAHICDIRPQDL